jgi:hypothetical protein
MNYIFAKNLAQKINYIVVHIVITVVTHFLGQKVELKQNITKYWLILFKIEVKKTILFDPMTGKKLIKGQILKNSFLIIAT